MGIEAVLMKQLELTYKSALPNLTKPTGDDSISVVCLSLSVCLPLSVSVHPSVCSDNLKSGSQY